MNMNTTTAWDTLLARWELPENELGNAYTMEIKQDAQGKQYMETTTSGLDIDGDPLTTKTIARNIDLQTAEKIISRKYPTAERTV